MARAAGHGRKDIEDQLRGMQAQGLGDVPSLDRAARRRGMWIWPFAAIVVVLVVLIVLVELL